MTSKTTKITWFLLVLHWAMDVIYDFYYIHGLMLFYMCHFDMGLTRCYKTTVFYIYICSFSTKFTLHV